jgi:hypothetical protein
MDALPGAGGAGENLKAWNDPLNRSLQDRPNLPLDESTDLGV